MSLASLDGALIAVDVDGTLLRPDGSVAERTAGALSDARDAGAVVSLATGRDWAAVRDLLAGLPAIEYSLCVNGIEVVTDDGTELHAEHLAVDVARNAILALRDALPGVAIGLGIGGELIGEPRLGELFPEGVGEVVPVEDAVDALGPDLRDLVVYHPDHTDDLDDFYDLCRRALPLEGLDLAFSGLPMLEIVPPGAGKDAGLAWLAGHLDIANERVVAFGDGLNDLSMLRWAGTGVAMGQARAAVIDAADEVTASNADDGVATWIEARLR
ncbi:MAG: HAD family hydrolase [Actinomycetota bacterium]